MKKFVNSIWTAEQKLKVYGIELGPRMTAIELDNGKLLLHSPIQMTPELVEDIQKLGKVSYIIAPNKWHHLYLESARETFPKAEYFGTQGLMDKKVGFQLDGVISNEQNLPWNPQLLHAKIEGVPIYDEVVFFHPESHTLILTDLAIHICHSHCWKTKLWLRILGSYGKFGWSSIEKKIFIKDKQAFKHSIDSILKWDFDRIVLSHGALIEKNGKVLLKQAFQ